jgi:hypothetical protein
MQKQVIAKHGNQRHTRLEGERDKLKKLLKSPDKI